LGEIPVKSKLSKEKTSTKKSSSKRPPAADSSGPLKGWTAIARFLGIPVATAHRWANEGMPVRREGRFTVADRDAVSAWLGRESHMPKPAHVMTADADMAAALKESIAAARKLTRNQKDRKD
jgi:phage terminase Nu1 subunit (DNA packaging protein)